MPRFRFEATIALRPNLLLFLGRTAWGVGSIQCSRPWAQIHLKTLPSRFDDTAQQSCVSWESGGKCSMFQQMPLTYDKDKGIPSFPLSVTAPTTPAP